MKRRRLSSAARRGGIMLIVAVVGALVIGAGVSYIVFGRSKAAKHADAKKSDEKAKEDEKGKRPAKEDEHDGDLTYVDLGAFLVNIVSEGELRYLRIEITLGVELPPEPKGKKKEGGHGGGKEEAGPKLPEGDDAIARDVIVRVLSVQSFAELRQGDRFTALSQQLQDALAESLEECTVRKVLFTSITMQ